jgi:hypothetical protein
LSAASYVAKAQQANTEECDACRLRDLARTVADVDPAGVSGRAADDVGSEELAERILLQAGEREAGSCDGKG